MNYDDDYMGPGCLVTPDFSVQTAESVEAVTFTDAGIDGDSIIDTYDD